jgi:hypothetical protein
MDAAKGPFKARIRLMTQAMSLKSIHQIAVRPLLRLIEPVAGQFCHGQYSIMFSHMLGGG